MLIPDPHTPYRNRSGDPLATAGVVDAIVKRLFPIAEVVTPNIPEAETILGDGRQITTEEDMIAAARDIHAMGAKCVVIKGGHLNKSGVDPEEAVDVLFDGERPVAMRGPWIQATNTHGTGCTLASAVAAHLSMGCGKRTAVQLARKYVQGAIRSSVGLAIGSGSQRPMNHAYATHCWAEGR